MRGTFRSSLDCRIVVAVARYSALMGARGVEYATVKLEQAEERGDYVSAVLWADRLDRVIALEREKALRKLR